MSEREPVTFSHHEHVAGPFLHGTEAVLRPETQDRQVFVDSVEVMASTHERVARAYLKDGTIGSACPPVRALLEIMADGISTEGLTLEDPAFRELFTRESVLASDWYAARLDAAQARIEAIRLDAEGKPQGTRPFAAG